MQKLFDEVASLDKRCYEEFFLSEDILMEHAARGMAEYIRENFPEKSKVIVVCGSGNNGADGIALSRLLHIEYDVSILYAKKPTSKMALLQQKRAFSIDVKESEKLQDCDVLVDAIVGTGFSGELSSELKSLIDEMNSLNAFKIACDVPSCYMFSADVTLTMGALKKSMFLDSSKEFVGKIKVLDLGVSREVYEKSSNWNLLDLEDIQLPYRTRKDSHKGSFGHLAVACGQMSGASIMSALSALKFGSGLVTLVGFEKIEIPHSLIYSHEVPKNATALALGMGLGAEFSKLELAKFLDNSLPLIADADIFYMEAVLEILKREKTVLTPHVKEFVSLLRLTGIADISVDELQKNRFKYVEMFCNKFVHVTLLLKGANVIIGQNNQFYVNPHGISALAKGGSGDVLSGLIGSLSAQGYAPLEAAIHASLAHVKLALNYGGADFSLTPDDLIDGISKL
ncbi:MAG: bifunctional ADP-dependent (S)-NAD(P)H-hydrate dehydratase/NAD(P)H-hydrate epimerase [Sulfurimonas sp. RIFOXYD12_FULL_33_39]|uniref:NAD(P)H-hydrate dehydratase n=1 Tax=unclassified Sulfurimonas TaxID=2623549 RepID=UPI0008B01D55|nr:MULTISPECIES: NAD(P)H-hydrate dehydratase [unclassified Sulfurimonas]OHE04403.1 MAG: bifunctional ADP-dependent (S)-NAD(P)H-hydrate dehydratase/NAD(P)H-hydrate epimerase [Sulfurimonas sp. RIFCSPLOWO2_12_FULL_34_6]OHE10348.1 MAG: bifunctional ADP-dependent (S)-NAD(P)H-hydrate dehydratase/NAD(P)H-hydrate epimerase [Sulfurimonas sp. RIFOXYD12_FULL_33_39]OHE13077.1 MAG: bifunctional ADP-dependent (S)-NAD(P)H-hydrate dehydratase/NAD(P)H-hydrate epimerase [Sulfurimonas sp. RIFOXYD2_FULL_34_21]DAB2